MSYDTSLSQDVSSLYLLMASCRSPQVQPRDRDSCHAAFVSEKLSGHLVPPLGERRIRIHCHDYDRGLRGFLLRIRTTLLHVVADGESLGH